MPLEGATNPGFQVPFLPRAGWDGGVPSNPGYGGSSFDAFKVEAEGLEGFEGAVVATF